MFTGEFWERKIRKGIGELRSPFKASRASAALEEDHPLKKEEEKSHIKRVGKWKERKKAKPEIRCSSWERAELKIKDKFRKFSETSILLRS